MQHGKIIINEARTIRRSKNVCRKLRNFTLTDDKRFYHVFQRFYLFTFKRFNVFIFFFNYVCLKRTVVAF